MGSIDDIFGCCLAGKEILHPEVSESLSASESGRPGRPTNVRLILCEEITSASVYGPNKEHGQGLGGSTQVRSTVKNKKNRKI
jgi:hypothetical protein